MSTMAIDLPQILYLTFCLLAIFFAVGVVAFKNPVSSAFSLICVLLSVAAVFAMTSAHFIAAVQILVYAGAIMVLFVFVIMLLSIEFVPNDFVESKAWLGVSFLASAAFFGLLVLCLVRGGVSPTPSQFTEEGIIAAGGNMRVISELMFSDYILPFELMGILLLLAIVGAIVLAKRKVE